MKIHIALPAYLTAPIGGYHVHYQYANRLSRRGHDVTLLFPCFLAGAQGLRARYETLVWEAKARLYNRPLIPAFPIDARVKVKFVRDLSGAAIGKADVLIATAWSTAEALAAAPRRCGLKVYIVYDYEYYRTADPATRERIESTYRLDFRIIATSTVVAATISNSGGEPVAQIPCGLDFEEFGVDVSPEDRSNVTIGFPVRHESFKGTADAIDAVERVRAHFGKNLRISAFGSRPVDMPGWIEWHQYPSQRDLRAFYNNNAIFVLPSHFEGWGLPGVEALACGAALVCADNGGCRDYALNDKTALVVPPGQPAELAGAISRLVSENALRTKLARDGHAFVQRFTWDSAVDRLEKIISA